MKIEGNSLSRPLINERVSKSIEQVKIIEDKPNENRVEDVKVNRSDLEKKIESINKFLEPAHTNLRFQLHDKLQEYYVTIVNTDTNQVVKEIPPKKFLDMYAFMIESIGLLVDYKI